MKKIFLVVCFFLFLLPAFSFAAYEPPESDILVFADSHGGVVSDLTERSRVPVFCLYKSGRLIYQERSGNNIRLMETNLSSEEIDNVNSMLQTSEEWNTDYENCPFREMPVFTIAARIEGEVKRFNIRGIEYAIKNKMLPSSLIKFYRHISTYYNDNAKKYEPAEIYFYIKSLPAPSQSILTRTVDWRSRLDLAALSAENSSGGVSIVRLSGKQAKNAVKDTKGVVPYVQPVSNIIFSHKKSFYFLAYRPLLPHEIE